MQPECWIKILKDSSLWVIRACHDCGPPRVLPSSLGGPCGHCWSGPEHEAWMTARRWCPWEGTGILASKHVTPVWHPHGRDHLLMLPHSRPHMATLGNCSLFSGIISINASWHVYHFCLILSCYLIFYLRPKMGMSYFPQIFISCFLSSLCE